MPDELVLEIPADAAFAVTARLFVAAAARGLGIGDGATEDLRLAASELVANAVETGQPGPIRLTVCLDENSIRLDASGAGHLRDDPPISRQALLGSLFEARDDAEHGILRLSAPVIRGADENQA